MIEIISDYVVKICEGKMIAFVCGSYVQTIRACHMHVKMKDFMDEADLFLVNPIFNNKAFIDRFRKTGIFNNIYYIDGTADEKAATLRYIHEKKYKNILKRHCYKKLISFNIEEIVAQALYNLNKHNLNFEYHCVEDTPSIYNIYIPTDFTWKHPYKWLGIEKQFYNIKIWWTSCPEYMDFPDKCDFEVRKLPAIDVSENKLLMQLNFIYGYEPDIVLEHSDCLIMEESHYTDGLMINNRDYNLFKKIVERYPQTSFSIKLHPRTKDNRFKGLLPQIQNSNMPWELIAWNRIVSGDSEITMLSIACGTMLSDKFMFGYEGTKILLAKLFRNSIKKQGGNCRITDELIAKYEQIKQDCRESEKFLLPGSEDELFDLLDKKWNVQNK